MPSIAPSCAFAPRQSSQSASFSGRAHHFETIEGERINDGKWLAEILREYQYIELFNAIDDFGAGFAGLNLLADFQPDIIKLDMDLIRNVDQRPARQAIVRGVVRIAEELGITIIAESIRNCRPNLTVERDGRALDSGLFTEQTAL